MAQSAAPIYFLIISILAQASGFIVGLLAGGFYPVEISPILSAACTVLFFSATAALVSYFLSLPKSWIIANGLVAPLLYLGAESSFPTAIILILAIILALIYLPAFWTRVPYYPTSLPMYQVVLDQLPAERDFHFIDIGCGFGPLLEFLSRQRPHARFDGIEIGILPYLISKLRFFLLRRRNVNVSFRSMWSINLARYDFVYCFLSPAPMERLWNKAQGEMPIGSLFMTNTFQTPAEADQILEVNDKHGCKLYLHRMT